MHNALKPPVPPERIRLAENRLERLEMGLREILREVEQVRALLGGGNGNDAASLAALSPREREVVERILAARRVGQIAVELGVSPHTVRNHLKAAFRKLGVHSQSELVDRYGA